MLCSIATIFFASKAALAVRMCVSRCNGMRSVTTQSVMDQGGWRQSVAGACVRGNYFSM